MDPLLTAVVAKPDSLSFISGALGVEGKNRHLKVIQ